MVDKAEALGPLCGGRCGGREEQDPLETVRTPVGPDPAMEGEGGKAWDRVVGVRTEVTSQKRDGQDSRADRT